jgi:hypothetical protein
VPARLIFHVIKGNFPLQSLCRSGLCKSAHAGVTVIKNNERFARAGKANVNGKRPLNWSLHPRGQSDRNGKWP